MKVLKSAVCMLSLAVAAPVVRAASGEPAVQQFHRTAISRDADGVLTVDGDGPQVKDDLFNGTEKFAARAKESSEVNLDKSMLSLAGKKGGSKGDLARKLDAVVVRSYEYEHEGDYNPADVEVYFKRLDAGGWKHIVRTREGKERTDICVKQDNEGQPRELVVITAEPKELTFIHISGHVSLADLQQLGGLAAGAMGDVMSGAVNGKEDDPKLQKH